MGVANQLHNVYEKFPLAKSITTTGCVLLKDMQSFNVCMSLRGKWPYNPKESKGQFYMTEKILKTSKI